MASSWHNSHPGSVSFHTEETQLMHTLLIGNDYRGLAFGGPNINYLEEENFRERIVPVESIFCVLTSAEWLC